MFSQSLLNSQIGEYQITNYVGAGGMGEVWRAVHKRLNREAAIKVLSRAAANPILIERFSNEARIQASLQHPAIATLYDYFEYNDHPCIVMEFINGQTLDELLQTKGVLPLDETIRIFKAVVEAVAYIHSHSIVHRDIKANNIKLTTNGAVKLLDFGISQSASTPKITEVGSIIGTWQYLSPEQINGGGADAQSDLWALGVLLYDMLTGALPFEATTIGSLTDKIKRAEYLTPSVLNRDVPSEIETTLAKCLRRNPAERYQSAQELLHDLEVPKLQDNSVKIPGEKFGAEKWKEYFFRLEGIAAWWRKNILLKAVLPGLALIFSIGGLSLFAGGGEGKSSGDPSSTPSAPTFKTVRVRLFQGRAEVFQNGIPIGSTPFEIKAPVNQRVSFLLKCSGCRDLPLNLPVSDDESKNEFIYQMQTIER